VTKIKIFIMKFWRQSLEYMVIGAIT